MTCGIVIFRLQGRALVSPFCTPRLGRDNVFVGSKFKLMERWSRSVAKPVKKKAPKPISESELRKLADAAMEDFKAEAKARYDKAHKVYVKQDDDTQDALDRMVTLLCRIARRNMWVSAGKRGDRLVLTIPDETVYHNMFYMGVEILKDLAIMDIRIANYTPPADLCAECGKEVKPKKKPTAKKKVKS